MSAWRLLPGYVRDADDGTLREFLAAAEAPVVTQVGRWLDTVADQVDPRSCPVGLLPWLARMVGADISGLDTDQARWLLARRGSTAAGSEQGIRDAVGATLAGDRKVTLVRAGLWSLTILIDPDDITDPGLTLDAAQRATPAGMAVDIQPTTPTTLADLASHYATLATLASTGKTLDQLRFG